MEQQLTEKGRERMARQRRRKARRLPREFDKITWPEKRTLILSYVGASYYVEDCIIAAGLTPQWYYKWKKLADQEIERAQEQAEREECEEYHNFIDDELKPAVDLVESIRAEQSKVIIANAEKIKASNPLEYNARVRHEQWGRKDRLEHTGAGGKDLKFTFAMAVSNKDDD